VNLSAKTEYACVAMLELALHHDAPEPVRIREIAERHGIPARFLVQILLQLKGAGLVTSTRGASGGYALARQPEAIPLDEVMSIVEGRPADPPAHTTTNGVSQVLRRVWREASEAQLEMLRSVSLADLASQVKTQHEPMYFI